MKLASFPLNWPTQSNARTAFSACLLSILLGSSTWLAIAIMRRNPSTWMAIVIALIIVSLCHNRTAIRWGWQLAIASATLSLTLIISFWAILAWQLSVLVEIPLWSAMWRLRPDLARILLHTWLTPTESANIGLAYLAMLWCSAYLRYTRSGSISFS